MGHSLFLAKLIGPCCMIVALAFLLNRMNYKKLTDDFLANECLQYFGAFMALIVGLMIVNTHNVWEISWRCIITVIGWIGIVKGMWLLLFPDLVKKFVVSYQINKPLLKVQLTLTLLFGVYLTLKGYF